MFWGGLIIFLSATALAWYLTRWFIPLSFRLNFLDQPLQATRKDHAKSTPLLGGAAVFGSFFVTVFLLLGLGVGLRGLIWDLLPDLAPLLTGAMKQSPKMVSLLTGAFLIFLLGLEDDRSGMHPAFKIAVLLVIGILLFVLDVRITLFVPFPPASFLFTLGWVVFLTNAFNLLDNMDGLSAGTAFICAASLLGVSIHMGQYLVAFYLLAFGGCLLGFWYFNFFGGRIFLGDSGALFIGYNLAVAAMLETYYIAGQSSQLVMAVPALIFALPLYDTLSVIVIRLRLRRSIFQGDQNHVSHRLVRSGFTRRQAVLGVYALAAVGGVTAQVLIRQTSEPLLPALCWVAAVLLLLFLIEKCLSTLRSSRSRPSATRASR